MKIAIIGAGNVGAALAGAWSKKGYAIVLGVRQPGKSEVQELVKSLANVSATDIAAAAAASKVVVLATPWPATKAAIEACGDLAGKIVIDCTNPVKPDLSGLEIGHTTSAAEFVAAWSHGASVFKAFNTTGANNMASLEGYPVKPAMFVAGDDGTKKPTVLSLAADLGFEAIDAGPLATARLLEPMAMLWIQLAIKQGLGVDFAFAVVKRGKPT
jgi:8-hydroxy-5-deazaflavin:NADPH oxidoreductase